MSYFGAMAENSIGNYTIIRDIGEGGMARIYLASHRDVPSLRVILKVVSDPQLAERFKREAEKLAQLDGHSGICKIKHFFNHGRDFVIAMEYIDGMTLEERIEQHGPLPVGETLGVIDAVLDVLVFAHKRGIFHRDIKPSNIMIDSDNRVKVIDFGIAKGEADPTLTAVNAYLGTPSYMAPEQFRSSEDINYAYADIYAIGTTIYQMLTGELPYKETDLFLLRDAKMFSKPPRPRKLRPKIPRDVEEIVLTAMEKEPQDRFPSVEVMRQVVQANSNFPGGPRGTTPKIKRRRRGFGWAATVAVVLALAAVIAFTPLRDQVTGLIGQNQPADIDTQPADISPVPAKPSPTPEQTERSGQPAKNEAAPAQVTGTVSLSVNLPSDVYIDGERIGRATTSLNQRLDTGQHVVTIRNDATTARELIDTMQITADEAIERSYELSWAPVSVALRGRPENVAIRIDGGAERTLPATVSLQPGRYTIAASHPTVPAPVTNTLIIQPGRDTTFSFDLSGDIIASEIAALRDSINVLDRQVTAAERQEAAYRRLSDWRGTVPTLLDTRQADSARKLLENVVNEYNDITRRRVERRTRAEQTLNDFLAAFAAKDLAAMEQLYPAMPDEEKQSWATFFKAAEGLSVDWTVDSFEPSGARATADVDLTMSFTDRSGNRTETVPWRLTLAERDNRWVVTARDAR